MKLKLLILMIGFVFFVLLVVCGLNDVKEEKIDIGSKMEVIVFEGEELY